MLYPVTITETLARDVFIEADSPADAEAKAEDLYNDCKIVLDMNDIADDCEIKFNSDAMEWASPYDVDAYVYNGGERLKARAEDGKVLFIDQYGNKFELKPYKD